MECNQFSSSSVDSRREDIYEAFTDNNVKGILSVIGGFNSNQLLDKIDLDLISNNLKVFCGYSDITVLQNAIFKKTDLITYYGAHYGINVL